MMSSVNHETRTGRAFAGAAVVVTALVFAPGFATAQATATQKTKAAAHETKQDTKAAAHETKQETKAAAHKTGNAITDSWITMKVHAQFVPENALEDSDIDVDTKAGVVTLMGTVPTSAGKSRAVAIAKATDGVKSVNDRLRVVASADHDVSAAAREGAKDTKQAAHKAGHTITDGWMTSKIYADYIDENVLEGSDIDVDVKAGVATLKGTVPTQAGSTRAAAIAKATDGVKTVHNNLKVVPKS